MDENLRSLYGLSMFNKKYLFEIFMENIGNMSKSTMEKYLKKYLESGKIARIGRNAYCIKGELRDYEYDYSRTSIHISGILNKDFYDLDFRIGRTVSDESFFESPNCA